MRPPPDQVFQEDCAPSDMPAATVMFAVFLCMLFGANAVAIKISFKGFGVYTTAAIRFLIASAVIAVWARTTGRTFAVPRRRRAHLLLYSLLFALQLSLFYTGLSRSHASRATLIINSLPFMILVLSHFFIPGDRITLRKLFGILVGFFGVAVLSLDGSALSSDFRIGDGLCLMATMIWAGNTILFKRFISDLRPFHVVLYSMLAAIPVVGLAALFLDQAAILNPTPDTLLALLYQSLVTAVFGFIAWNTLLQRHGAVALHTFLFLLPPVGVFLGALLLDEPVNTHIMVSMVLIVAGIMVVHWKGAKPLPAYAPRKNI